MVVHTPLLVVLLHRVVGNAAVSAPPAAPSTGADRVRAGR
jgi:hypothetical protein